ncbi:MAG TPA: hypothetical protein PLZ52_12220 [Bacteroidales bacterium]|nr:hypothetical protein [Bacteroidales bacterium]HOE05974.1 hypothetical protein [Bacteroidales bacterium]
MMWYQWLAVAALAVCIGSALFHFIRLIRLGKPRDYSKSTGSENAGIKYSFTAAMSPKHKESAYLHLPTYTAGMIYHLATFLAIAVFLVYLTGLLPEGNYRWLVFAALLAGSVSGIAILIKRFVVAKLRKLSNPDDYISNLLVDVFQLTGAIAMISDSAAPAFYVAASLLLFYFPLGKLKHAVYFFAARYHLGVFFGRRGVWPSKPY